MSTPEESNQWTLEPLGMTSPRRFVTTVRSQIISGLIAGHQVEEKLLRKESPASKEKGRKAVSSRTQVERSSGGKKGSPKGSKGGSKEGGKATKGKDKGKGKSGKSKRKAMGNVEAEKEPEAEEQAGSWDASGWEGRDDSGWNNWTEGGQGSRLEGNYLSLGALHGSAMVTKRHERAVETRSGLPSKSVIAAI